MKISVIVPTYKPQEYIYDCINSLCNQTLDKDNYEVVIILNGCKEPFFSELIDYKKSHLDTHIIIIQTENCGVAKARNLGMEYANGEYITFIDDDDLVTPSYLSDLLTVSSPTCVGCATSYAFVNDISEEIPNFISKAYQTCKNKDFSLLSYRQFLSPPVLKLIHKDIIGHSQFPINLTKSEDSVFCLSISPRIKDMKLAPDTAIYFQRIRNTSTTHAKTSFWKELNIHLKIECEYIKVWMANPFEINAKFALSRLAACIKNLKYYLSQ